MKMRAGLVALLSLALLGAYVHAQFGEQAAKLDLVKVSDDLFVIHNDFVPGKAFARTAGSCRRSHTICRGPANVKEPVRVTTALPLRAARTAGSG